MVFDELEQRADADARRTFRAIRFGIVSPRRARDVQVRPCETVGKLFQERGGSDRAGFAPADVFDVGDVGFDLLRVFRIERQLPMLLADLATRSDDLGDQRLIRAHHGDVDIAERDHDRAG